MAFLRVTLAMCFLACWTLQGQVEGTNLLSNPGFESADYLDSWKAIKSNIARTSVDAKSGSYSLNVTGRTSLWGSPRQDGLTIPGNKRYEFTAWINIQDLSPGLMYQKAILFLACWNAANNKINVKFGKVPYLLPNKWIKLGGVSTIPEGYTAQRAYVQVYEMEANYLIDDFSLVEVPDLADWKGDADARIDQLRKSNVTVTVTADGNPSNLEIELTQNKHKFAFGAAVGAEQIVDPALKAYQDFFYNNFEWGVFHNAHKWKAMEKTQGVVNYERPALATQALISHGITVRGHNVFWGLEKNTPDWVLNLTTTELRAAMDARIQGVVTNTSGQIAHWDVNNEHVHGDLYERRFGNPNVTMGMFKDVRAIDSAVKLFLNDYGAIKGEGLATMGLRNMALRFLEAGDVPIDGIGIQSHIYDSGISMTTVKSRLDMVAEAELPIFITELTVEDANDTKKAQCLTNLLTMYFSHPSVEGVLLWGYWDGKIGDPLWALATGADVTPNEAGQAYIDLYHNTWRTNVNQGITAGQPVTIRAFKGQYTLKVKQDGSVVDTQTFTLDDDDLALNVDLTGS